MEKPNYKKVFKKILQKCLKKFKTNCACINYNCGKSQFINELN